MHVFITRPLASESPFARILQSAGHRVEGRSLVDFQPEPFEEPRGCGWLFFYSKTGVQFFFQQRPDPAAPLPKLAALGKGTAEALEKYHQKVDFIGNGHPEVTAQRFAQVVGDETVCFIRARTSAQSVQNLLAHQIRAAECVVYSNRAAHPVAPIAADVLVFTSPLNAVAYLETHDLQPFQRVLSIGQTTARELDALGIRDYAISAAPDEENLAQAALKIIETL